MGVGAVRRHNRNGDLLMTDNVVQFESNVPIFNTDGQLAFECADDTVCGVDTDQDFYISFVSITDCGACDKDGEDLNGNKYQLSFDSIVSGTYVWTYNAGDLYVRLFRTCYPYPPSVRVVAYKKIAGEAHYIFESQTITSLTDLPMTVVSTYVIGMCCTGSVPYHWQINAYGGEAEIDLS